MLWAMALMLLLPDAATAQGRQEQAQKILQEIGAGRDASALILQYRQNQPGVAAADAVGDAGSGPFLTRSSEIRQYQQAGSSLANALQDLQGSGFAATALPSARAAYLQWRAAELILAVRHQAIEQKLQDSAAGSVYLSRHQDMVRQHRARQQQVQTLLNTWLADDATPSTAGKGSSKNSATLVADKKAEQANISTALGLLPTNRKNTRREPILHALNLPVGALNLPTRSPKQSPVILPTYADTADTTPQDADSASAPEAPLSDDIIKQAKALNNDYVRIYEFVRNQHRTEWYAGSVKGAIGTLRSGAGNDLDQASLLVALLRAAGVPARYVHGVVELTLDKVVNDLGLADASLVPQALRQAGVAYSPVVRGGRVVAVQLEHNWVSAFVPYTNYRGAVVDGSGKSWIPLDPSHKQSQWLPAKLSLTDVSSIAALQQAYLAQVQNKSLAGFVKKRVVDYLEAKTGSAVDYAAQLGQQQIAALNLSLLPNTLPYPVLAVTSEGALLPASERVQAHLLLRSGSAIVLDTTIAMSELNNQRLTLTYLPASLEDHRLTLSFGGLDAVPLYLIKLRPQFAVGGKVQAVGSDGVEPGTELRLEMRLEGPFGTQITESSLMAGALQVLAFSGSAATRPSLPDAADTESQAAHLLDGIAFGYNKAWFEGEAQMAALSGVRLLRPVPAVTLVTNHFETVYLDDVPQGMEWKGVTMDAASHPLEAIGTNASDFLLLAGLHGSSLESQVFQDQFSVEAVSADKGLGLARQQGVAILNLTSANADALNASDHTQAVRDNINNLLRLGYRVEVPARRISDQAWSGSVWRAQDEASGASGYFISGGLAGGSTATAPDLWPVDFLPDALNAQNADGFNEDLMAGVQLIKIGAADGQVGVVGKKLPRPMMVLVRDKRGFPVKGAQVQFQVSAGGGSLNGEAVYTTSTNSMGMASIALVLGQQTSANPSYMYLSKDDRYPSLIGQNWVEVSVNARIGTLHLDTPFQAIGMPDKLATLTQIEPFSHNFYAAFAYNWGVQATDQYHNPIANLGVDFSVSTQPTCDIEKAGELLIPAAVFDGSSNCPANSELGNCGAPQLTQPTYSNGSAAVGVFLGSAVTGINTVTAKVGGLTQTYVMKAQGACGEPDNAFITSGVVETNSDGENANAAAPLTQFKIPMSGTLYKQLKEYETRTDSIGRKYLYHFGYSVVKPTTGQVTFAVTGGGFSADTTQTGPGSYQTKVTVGPVGRVAVTASAVDAHIRRFVQVGGSAGPFEERDSTVSFSGLPIDIYSVRPNIEKLQTSDGKDQINLADNGLATSQVSLQYKINPPEYGALGVSFDLYQNGVVVNSGTGDKTKAGGTAYLPRDQVFDNKNNYEAELVLNRGSALEIRSERFPLPTRQKLITGLRSAGASLDVDVLNKRACELAGSVEFGFGQKVSATLEYEPVDSDGRVNGVKKSLFSGKAYDQGLFSEIIYPKDLGPGTFRFTLSATGVRDPSQQESVATWLGVVARTHNRLPVGHVLIKGVDLKGGNLTLQSQSLGVSGRGPVFHFQPSYSSGSNGAIGHMGTNWSHNFESGLHTNSCGEYIVSAGDGGSVRFVPDQNGKFIPDLGYHGTLERDDGSGYNFYSKDGTLYHYKFIDARVQWKVDQIVDTNGNSLTLNYDYNAIPEPLLASVVASDGRSWSFKYAIQAVRLLVGQGAQRPFLAQVSGPDGLTMQFTHDEYGNLTQVDRAGRIEQFHYKVDDPDFQSRSLMLAYTDPNSNATSYDFNAKSISFTQNGVLIVMPNSYVSAVHTPTGNVGYQFNLPEWTKATLTDENGNLTEYELNQYGSPISIKDPAGTTTMQWAENDITMLSKTDARGVTTAYTYDSAANMVSETVDGKIRRYTYLIQDNKPWMKNRRLSQTDRNGNVTRYAHDDKGNVVEEYMPNGIVIKHGYTSNGDRLQTTDGEGGQTRFGYDDFGNLAQVTNQIGAITQTQRDGRGRVIVSRDGNGNATRFQYDPQDRMTTHTDAKGMVRGYEYDANGNKISETDELSRKTLWTYNGLNLPTKIERTDNNSKTIGYDKIGNKIAETDYRGNTTSYLYDGVNRLIKRTEPKGKLTSYQYDEIGNVLSETDALGRVTRHSYDKLSRRTGTIDGAGGVWAMAYDGNGNKTASTDPEGRNTASSYDELNRLSAVTQELGRSTRYQYDRNNNKTIETDPNGQTSIHAYDAANRLIKLTDTNGKETSYDYDKSNNLIRAIDPNLNATRYSYDVLNRKQDMTDGEGYTTRYSHDPIGNLIQEDWPNGNAITHGYDKLNRLSASSDKLGQLGAWDYDPDGNQTSETDANGNASQHQYNELSQRIASTLPADRSMTYEYDLMGNRLAMTDPDRNTTRYQYDRLNRQTGITDANGGTHTISYDKVGNKLAEIDPNGNTTTYTWDKLNRLGTVLDAKNQSMAYEYDLVGNKLKEMNKRGISTAYTYDKMHRLTSVTKANLLIAKNQYDAGGNLLFATDANGNTTNYEYDKRNVRTAENRLLGAITKYKLDAMGDIKTATDPEGRSTTNSHDLRRRLQAVSNGAGEVTQYAYDANGNRTAITHPLGNGSSIKYDAANRVIEINEPVGTTKYDYDKNGNHITLIDAKGNRTQYGYDAMNRRTGISYPEGASERFVYDKNGNLITHADGNGIVVGHSYDELNRDIGKTYSGNPDGLKSITSTYDANNNVIAVAQTDAAGVQKSSYSFDDFDRQQSHTDAFGAQAQTSYDANGNKTSVATQDGKVTRYSYDALNRLSGIVGQSGSISYTYDRSSLNTGIAYSNGTSSSMSYDAAKRVKIVNHQKARVSFSETRYEYDKNGNRSTETINRIGAAQVSNYRYDSTDRLTQTSVIDAVKTVTTDYTLDAVGNRTNEEIKTQVAGGPSTNVTKSYRYDGRNQLVGISDSVAGETGLAYDKQGNLVQKTRGSDITTYRYDARDYLLGVSQNATVLGSYRNDHLGLRIEKEAKDPLQPGAPPVKLRTLWDGRMAFQDRSTDGDTLSRYDSDGRHPVGMWSKDDGAQALHHDALGSIVATTDNSGAVKSETIYDAFGNIQEEKGKSANKFGYTGHQMDKESGLIYFQARYYDPQIGRFITQDPFEGDWMTPMSLHHYLYAYANPTSYIDVDGNIAILAEAANQLSGFNSWLSSSTAGCNTGIVCGVAGATIGVTRGVVGLGEVALRGSNLLANTVSLAAGQVGLNSQENIDAHAKEISGTIDALDHTVGAVKNLTTEKVADKVFSTAEKALVGDAGAVSNITEIATGFVGGGGAAKAAVQGEKAAVRAATRDAAKAEAIAAKETRNAMKPAVVEAPPAPTAEVKAPSAQVTKEGEALATAGENSPAAQNAVGARTVFNLKEPGILKDPNLGAAERALIEADFNIKVRVLQKAAKNGELNYRPGTEDVRISELQAKYRQQVIERFERRYGKKPDIAKLDADHPVDLIVGGEADQALKLLHRSANRSIGSQLKKEAERLKLEPGAPIDEIRMPTEE
jgi:RHS repeat-associated protein